MIKTENITIKGRPFVRTYSDSGCYVVRDGIAYDEAVDPVQFGRQYTEGDPVEMTETEQKIKAYDILTGVEK